MAISPSEILDLATFLLGEEKEVCYRSAASRAYYAAYHFCLPVAETLPANTKRKGSHQRLVDRLRNHPLQAGAGEKGFRIREIGNLLEKGRLLRTRADYDLERNFSRVDAEETVLPAEKIRNLIQKIA